LRPNEIASQILAVGPDCELLEPAELREKIGAQARSVASHYDSSPSNPGTPGPPGLDAGQRRERCLHHRLPRNLEERPQVLAILDHLTNAVADPRIVHRGHRRTLGDCVHLVRPARFLDLERPRQPLAIRHRGHLIDGADLDQRRDAERGIAVGGEYSKPLLLMLSIWYHDRGVQLVHAGLIAREGAGVLLPGESGTGKSTMSLAGAAQGLGFLGDDFVGLERAGDGIFLGHSIFNTVCIARDGLDRFPTIRAHAVEESSPEEEKPILFLSEIYPDRIERTVPIRAVALLGIGRDRSQVRPARPAAAMRQVAASTLHTVVPRPGRDALQLIGELVARVPAYSLLLGPDLREIRRSIDRILSGADGGNGV